MRISGSRLWAVAQFEELEPSSLKVANIIGIERLELGG
jgi:hypothetical protein